MLVLEHCQVRHHRDHRLGVVPRARHQLQAVTVGLQLVFTRDLRHQTRFGQTAEVVDQRREQRGDTEENVENLRFRLRGDDVAPLDVTGFVADDACKLVVGLNEVDEALVDVHESAHRCKGVDAVVLDDLDGVRHVFTRDLIPKVFGDALNVGVEKRIGFDDAARDDLLVFLLAQLDLGGSRHRESRGRDAGEPARR